MLPTRTTSPLTSCNQERAIPLRRSVSPALSAPRIFFLFFLLLSPLPRLGGTGGCTHEDGSYLRSARSLRTRSTPARRNPPQSRFSTPSAFRPGLPFVALIRCPRLVVFAFLRSLSRSLSLSLIGYAAGLLSKREEAEENEEEDGQQQQLANPTQKPRPYFLPRDEGPEKSPIPPWGPPSQPSPSVAAMSKHRSISRRFS